MFVYFRENVHVTNFMFSKKCFVLFEKCRKKEYEKRNKNRSGGTKK